MASDDASSAPRYSLAAIRPGDPVTGSAVTFDFIKDVEHEVFERYRMAHARVADVYDGDLSVYAVAALEQLNNLIAQIELFAVENQRPAQAMLRRWHTILGGAVLTLCSAIHLYQEQTESAVERHFGSGSPEHLEIHSRFSAAYDGSFGYRVLYRLRNVLVHHSMKSIGMSLSVRLQPDEDGREHKVATMSVPVVRESLLAAKKSVNAKMRTELQHLDADPDIREYAHAAIEAIDELRRTSVDLVHPNLLADCATLAELSEEFPPWSEAQRALATVTVSNGVPNFPHTILRREVFDYADTTSRPGPDN